MGTGVVTDYSSSGLIPVLAFAPNVLKTHLNFSQEIYTLIFNLETITQ